jgi:hypothetical protein
VGVVDREVLPVTYAWGDCYMGILDEPIWFDEPEPDDPENEIQAPEVPSVEMWNPEAERCPF